MTASQSNLAGLSRFVFRAPSWRLSLAFALVLSGLAGIAAFESGTATSWQRLLFLGEDAGQGVFYVGIPTVVAALITAGVDRSLGGQLTRNHASLLALVCEVVVVAMLVVAAVVAVATTLGQQFVFDVLVVALASIFALRLLVIMAVSRHSLAVAAIPASIQTATSALLLFVYTGTIRVLEVGESPREAYLFALLARGDRGPQELALFQPEQFLLLGALCVLYGIAVYAFLVVVDRPWQQSLGVSVLDFCRGFVGHVAEGSRELEDFFEQIGEDATVPVTVLSFRRLEDDIDGDSNTDNESGSDSNTDGDGISEGDRLGEEKVRFVLPMVHPGPMGEIGGGNLPMRIAERVEGLAFPPHATAGHDFNLVTEREVGTLLDAADRAADCIKYNRLATPSVRTEAGESSMLGQAFGTGGLLVNSFASTCADDIEYGVGLAAIAEARAGAGARSLQDVLLVDAHNCNDGLTGPDLGHVTTGSSRSLDVIEAARGSGKRLADTRRGPIRLGVAWDRTDWGPADGIGPLGIRVAVVEVDTREDDRDDSSGSRRTAYVVVDGNNMVPGLRDRIVDDLLAGEPRLDDVEVMTTDTHVVNTVESDNRVGDAVDGDELVAAIRRLAEEALADREPVAAGMAREHAEVTVFGNDRTETLASHANAAVAMGGALAAAVTVAAMAISVLLFFVT